MGKLKLKLNNKGAAMISVLVVTTFITILATTLLYVAAMNFQQKQTDYENKQSFYQAEKALDELKSVLVTDVQEAYATAYNKTTRNFARMDASQCKGYFQDEFMAVMKDTWKDRVDASTESEPEKKLLGAVKSAMTGSYATEAGSFYKVLDYGVYETTEGTEKHQKFALRGVQVKYTVGNYTTFLYTDICIEPPAVDWGARGSTSDSTLTAPKERDLIAFTDYVSYVNWRKADYEVSDASGYNSIDIGTKVP